MNDVSEEQWPISRSCFAEKKKKADFYNASTYSTLLKDLKAEILKVVILSDNSNHYFSQFRVTTLADISAVSWNHAF
jgi:hypothetical protein